MYRRSDLNQGHPSRIVILNQQNYNNIGYKRRSLSVARPILDPVYKQIMKTLGHPDPINVYRVGEEEFLSENLAYNDAFYGQDIQLTSGTTNRTVATVQEKVLTYPKDWQNFITVTVYFKGTKNGKTRPGFFYTGNADWYTVLVHDRKNEMVNWVVCDWSLLRRYICYRYMKVSEEGHGFSFKKHLTENPRYDETTYYLKVPIKEVAESTSIIRCNWETPRFSLKI